MQVDAKAEVQGRPIGATCCLSPSPSPSYSLCVPSSLRTVTIQLDLKFDYKIPSTKCAIGKHFSTVRARVFGIFSGQPTILAVFYGFFFQPLWEIVTVSKSFFVCHWFVGPVTERHFVSSQRKFPTAEYDEYNSPLINTIPPFIHSFCVCNCRYNSFYNYIKYTKSHSKSSRTELTQFQALLNIFLGYEPPTNCQKRQLRKLQLIFS